MKLTEARRTAIKLIGDQGLRFQRLRAKTGRNDSSCQRLVKGMEGAGLVSVDGAVIQLTPAGRALLAEEKRDA